MAPHAVEPGSARWKELVAQGIIKDGDRNWFLGDAALEIAPMGRDGVNNGSTENLERYANEIGVKAKSIQHYRDVASAWPPPTRVGGTSWKVHQMLSGRQDLIRPGMTVNRAVEALGGYQPSRGAGSPQPEDTSEESQKFIWERAEQARNALADPEVAKVIAAQQTPEERAAQVRAALKDPEVTDAIAADRETVREMDAAREKIAQKRLDAMGSTPVADDPNRMAREAYMSLVADVRRSAALISEVIADIEAIPPGLEVPGLDREIKRGGAGFDRARAARPASSTIDDELDQMLRRG